MMGAFPMIAHKTRAQQRLEHLLSLKRPLEPDEQDELYRSLHADYMRKWRAHKVQCEAEEHNHALYLDAVAELRG